MKQIHIRLSDETYEKMRTVKNKNEFVRIAIEEAFNRKDSELGDDTYITRKEFNELRSKLEATGLLKPPKQEVVDEFYY